MARVRLRLVILTLAAGSSALPLGGCVSSQAGKYEHRITSVIASEHRASPQVAVAFGLDGERQPATAVAVAGDE